MKKIYLTLVDEQESFEIINDYNHVALNFALVCGCFIWKHKRYNIINSIFNMDLKETYLEVEEDV